MRATFGRVAGLALVVVAAGACTSGGSPSAAPSPAPATPAPATSGPATSAPATSAPATSAPTRSAPASASASAPPAVPTRSPSRPSLPECTAAQLTVTAGPEDGALGHSGVAVVFTNTSGTRCFVRAYPGVAGLDAAGSQVTQAVRTPSGYLGGLPPGTTSPPEVVLGPGDPAAALVEGSNVPQGTATTCPTLAGLLVTPPDTRTSVRLAVAPGDCDGLAVHPVVPGTDGSLNS